MTVNFNPEVFYRHTVNPHVFITGDPDQVMRGTRKSTTVACIRCIAKFMSHFEGEDILAKEAFRQTNDPEEFPKRYGIRCYYCYATVLPIRLDCLSTAIFGHTSFETAFIQDDYPYGHHRTQRAVWIERNNKGSRFVYRTMNPRNGKWNTPHASTYDEYALMYLDEINHVRVCSASFGHINPWVLDIMIGLPNMPEVEADILLRMRSQRSHPLSWWAFNIEIGMIDPTTPPPNAELAQKLGYT